MNKVVPFGKHFFAQDIAQSSTVVRMSAVKLGQHSTA